MPPPRAPLPLELVLVGGGLQNALVALAALDARPDLRIALFERGDTLGGNHTWCFHDGDVPADAWPWLAPLVSHRWDGYDVAFAGYRRRLDLGYAAVTSADLDRVVRARFARAPHAMVRTRAEVEGIAPGRIVARVGGEVLEVDARTVVDARGPDRLAAVGGWQKFVGHEVALARPHDLTGPILMDATVAQVDGLRFFYVLPLGPTRLLVEDTRFSDGPHLDVDAIRAELAGYRRARGWDGEVVREETGVLPMPWHAEVADPVPGLIHGGYQGGWFHPVTGYSFPVALRVAGAIADALGAGVDPVRAVAALIPDHRAQLRFALRLSWMMFKWFAPERRIGVLEHFYRLPDPVVRRFYALALTGLDRARMFVGRPPRGLSWRAMLTGGAPAAAPEAS